MAKEKKQNNIVRNMMIALVGGLVVGLGFMLLKQQMSEGTWNVINALLFQDITADQGFHSIGLFYIIGQLFMRGLQMAIVPLVLVSLSLAMCSISSSSKLGRIAGRTLLGFFCFYVVGALHRRYCCIRNEIRRILQRKTSGRGSYRGCNTGSV